MNIVAVVPARGGSKGLPGKNIKNLNGKPLISYTIEAALKCDAISRVVCSTDDAEIAKIALIAGAEVPFLRPKHLSTDEAPTPPVIEHAIHYIESQENKKVDIVVTLQPTSPLRNNLHIERALSQFFGGCYDSLVSVRTGHSPWWMFTIENDEAKPLLSPKEAIDPFNLGRQNLPTIYEINGAIYITNRDFLEHSSSIISRNNCDLYIMSQEDSLDIDTMVDFKITEEILKSRAVS